MGKIKRNPYATDLGNINIPPNILHKAVLKANLAIVLDELGIEDIEKASLIDEKKFREDVKKAWESLGFKFEWIV